MLNPAELAELHATATARQQADEEARAGRLRAGVDRRRGDRRTRRLVDLRAHAVATRPAYLDGAAADRLYRAGVWRSAR